MTVTTDKRYGSATVHAGSTIGESRRFRIRLLYAGEDGITRQSTWRTMDQTVETVDPEAPYVQQPVSTMMPYRVVRIWRRKA